MRRVTLIGLFSIFVGLLLWLSLRGLKPHALGRAPEPDIATLADADWSPVLEPVATSAQRGAATVAPVTQTATEAVSPEVNSRSVTATQHRLTGTVVVLDEQQVEHPTESGSLTLLLWRSGAGQQAEVKVDTGRWEIDVDDYDLVEVERAELGDRPAFVLNATKPIPLPEAVGLELRFRWASPMIVHARDAVTGIELSGVEIVPSRSQQHDDLIIPVSTSVTSNASVLTGHSPLSIRMEDVPGLDSTRSIFVRAHGYAWAHVKCDPKQGGDLFADLVPACSIDVTIEGDQSAAGIHLQMTESGQYSPVLDMPLIGRKRLTIDSVPPGEYELNAMIVEASADPVLLDSSAVILTAGARGVVTLAIRIPPPAVTANLSGTLLLPTAWDRNLSTVNVAFIGESSGLVSRDRSVPLHMRSRTQDLLTYDWHIEEAELGPYEFSLYEPSFACVVELTQGGTSGVRVEVPPPANVVIRVVDSVTNLDVSVDGVGWYGRRPLGSRGVVLSAAVWNQVTGHFEARCPLGEVVFSASATNLGYLSNHALTNIRPGDNEVRLLLQRATGARLILKDGDRDLPIDPDRDFVVKPEVGTGEAWSWARDTGADIYVSEPGPYRISFKGPKAGYLKPEDQLIDLKSGTMTDVVIRLTRKP